MTGQRPVRGDKPAKKRTSRKPKSMDEYFCAMQKNRPREESMALRLRNTNSDPVEAARAGLGLPALLGNTQLILEGVQ